MKINIRQDESLEELEVLINCPRLNTDVEKIISMLRVMDFKLTGTKGGQTYILDAAKVIYIDTVDKHTFFYTKSDMYETDLKLYELEERLFSFGFIRANKSCVINFNRIKAIKTDIDGKLLLTMDNEERLYVSRQYAPALKKRLEGK